MPLSCNRLRLGGIVSGSNISGGVSVQNNALFTISLAGLMGHPGRRGGNVTVPYLDGQLRRASKPSLPRFITLTVEVMDRDEFGLIPTTRGEQWEENMDLLMSLADGEGESVILERDMQDGTTRFIEGETTAAWGFMEGPLKNQNHVSYIGPISLECHHPYWQSEQEFTKSLGSAFVPPGTATLFNQVFSFTGAGTVHHHESGADIIVTTGTWPLLVDCGKRQVTVAGADASNRAEINKGQWMRFKSGVTQTFTSTAAGSMLYRAQYL